MNLKLHYRFILINVNNFYCQICYDELNNNHIARGSTFEEGHKFRYADTNVDLKKTPHPF